MTNIWNGNGLEGMTIIRKEWQYHGRNDNNLEGMTNIKRNDSNTEGMTIMGKEWHKVFFWKKQDRRYSDPKARNGSKIENK